MGGRGSKLKRFTSVFTGESCDEVIPDDLTTTRRGACPFVLTRKGSMFIDEDGDVAHEFYEEIPSDEHDCKARLRQTFDNLQPQGEVAHEYTRLNPNLPVIMCENC